MVQDTPSRKFDQYIVRFPDGMRDRLKDAAVANKRSLNAEIVARLEASLDKPMTLADLAKYLPKRQPPDDPWEDMKRRIQELSKQIEALREEGYGLGKPKK